MPLIKVLWPTPSRKSAFNCTMRPQLFTNHFRLWRFLFWIACRYGYLRYWFYRRVVYKLWPDWTRKIHREIMVHACHKGKLPLWRRWEMQRLHNMLGDNCVPHRFLIFSPAEYHRKEKMQNKFAKEIIDEILAERPI